MRTLIGNFVFPTSPPMERKFLYDVITSFVFRNGQLCEGVIFLDEIGNIYSINNGINETSNVRCMYENMELK